MYNYKKSDVVRDWKWLSKKLSLTNTISDKRFHRIKMLGNPTVSSISTPPKWKDDVVVYVDGEIQQLNRMNTKYTKSFAGCFLSATINDSVTTVAVDGKNDLGMEGTLPAINTYIMIDDEIMLVTAQPSATSLTVTRAQLGTTAVEHATPGNMEQKDMKVKEYLM